MTGGRPRRNRIYLVAFWDTLYPSHREYEVHTSKLNATRSARENLDPGWKSEIHLVTLDPPLDGFYLPPLVYDEDIPALGGHQ